VTIVVLSSDLLIASRIISQAESVGEPVIRIDDPHGLPDPAGVALVFVDWAQRQPGWAAALEAWRARAPGTSRMILFGPHTDLEAHREAREAGIGPMMARSRLMSSLPEMLAGRAATG
jgi:hypothetical protein